MSYAPTRRAVSYVLCANDDNNNNNNNNNNNDNTLQLQLA
jgi:hypothetical protein